VSDATLLVIDDDLVDVKGIRRELGRNGVRNPVFFVEDGEGALLYLRRHAPHEEAARPALVLLDLNLPRLHGLEVLREVRRDPDLREVPVVVLSTSDEPTDLASAHELGAVGYMIKPFEFGEFAELLRGRGLRAILQEG